MNADSRFTDWALDTIVMHSEEAERSCVRRTVYASTGPGVQADPDQSPAGLLAMEFENVHQARLYVPPAFDQLSGPQRIEDGVRVSWATNPLSMDRRPVLFQFDSMKFSEAQARKWINKKYGNMAGDYQFQPDARDKPPVTQGTPSEPGEKHPEGFSDLAAFYAATLSYDAERAASTTTESVTRKTSDDTQWITVSGAHIPIGKGQSKEQAVKEHIAKQDAKGRGKSKAPKEEKPSDRAARAKASHNPSSVEKQRESDRFEKLVADKIGAKRSDDNRPMDNFVNDKHGVELKVMHDQKASGSSSGRVNMRPDSRARKEAWVAEQKGRTAHTVLIDNRDKFEGGNHAEKFSGHNIYYKPGVGAFRLETMIKVKDYSDLKALITGDKATKKKYGL